MRRVGGTIARLLALESIEHGYKILSGSRTLMRIPTPTPTTLIWAARAVQEKMGADGRGVLHALPRIERAGGTLGACV